MTQNSFQIDNRPLGPHIARMHLITMAHLGEAQGVIELFKLKKKTPQIFEGETITCLITGEGPFEAATSTAALLGSQKFESVINLGIAGSLSADFKIGEIYPVRSIYLVIDGKPQFKSFKSSEKGFDCLTSFERILSPEKALPLSGIASLVDREVWGVAMAAKAAGVECHSFKLVSDQAGSLGACEVVREMADEWSRALAVHLQSVLEMPVTPKPEVTLPGFYFTFTTQHQLEQMLRKIALREELSTDQILNSLNLDSIREEIAFPKERARVLLNRMEERLDPMKAQLSAGLLKWKESFEKKGISLVTDPNWEDAHVKVQFSVANDHELKNKIALLNELHLLPFQDLRNGKTHVE